MATTKTRQRAAERDAARTPGDPAPLEIAPDLDAGVQMYHAGRPVDRNAVDYGDGNVMVKYQDGEQETAIVPRSEVTDTVPVLDSPEATPGDAAEPGDEPAAAETPDAAPAADAAPADAKATKPAGKPGRPKSEPKQPGLCVHGCGQRVQRPQAKFVRGHDSLLAQELRAAYAAGDKTAEQVREHAGLISAKFLDKMNRSIAAVDAEREATAEAARARKALLTASHKVAAARS